mmetsp:Transcript_7760/g.14326  ORF Transcript_7760/g.14326 Transcript_7760/m.14326 type:complete len:107 (-) Transcript_7760:117-437(-)
MGKCISQRRAVEGRPCVCAVLSHCVLWGLRGVPGTSKIWKFRECFAFWDICGGEHFQVLQRVIEIEQDPMRKIQSSAFQLLQGVEIVGPFDYVKVGSTYHITGFRR